MRTVRAETGEQSVEVSGLRVRVRVQGDGPPILLINGLGANVATWTPLQRQLSAFKVICFDAPGTGQSQTLVRPYRIPRIATVAAAILDELGIGATDVLGYSLGGAVAQQLARQYPERVRRLVLVSSSCGAGAVPGSLRALLAVMTPARHYSTAGYRAAMRMVDLAPAEKESRVLADQIRGWHHQAAPSVLGYALQMNAFSTFHSLPWLHEVTQPALVLSGTDDHLIPLANSAILAAYLPNARLRRFERWGHYLLHDQASGAAETIADFLSADSYTDSAFWRAGDQVSRAEMADLVRAAPKSAHPSVVTGGILRRLCPPKIGST